MTNQFTIPKPVNEPIKVYGPGSPEKASLQAKADELSSKVIDIPLVIGGEEVRTGNTAQCVMPHDHGHILANFHQAGEKEVEMAINASQEAWQSWSKNPWKNEQRSMSKLPIYWPDPGGTPSTLPLC